MNYTSKTPMTCNGILTYIYVDLSLKDRQIVQGNCISVSYTYTIAQGKDIANVVIDIHKLHITILIALTTIHSV